MFVNSNITLKLAFLFVCFRVLVLAQSTDFDINLVNRNFKILLSQRLNSFPKPQYVRNTQAAFINNRLGFDLKFILGDEYERYNKGDGIVTLPFVISKTIFVVVHEQGVNKLKAALDIGHAEHDAMIRSIDFGLLANELILEMTSTVPRNDILQTLAQISKMEDGEPKQKAIEGVLTKHFSASKIVRFFLTLRLRYGDIYPDAGLFETINYILGKDVKEELSNFLLGNLVAF